MTIRVRTTELIEAVETYVTAHVRHGAARPGPLSVSGRSRDPLAR